MFRTEEIEKLDKSYFNIILAENYDVTIQSKNTGHIWYIHNPEYLLNLTHKFMWISYCFYAILKKKR